jgi:hypothetical protein
MIRGENEPRDADEERNCLSRVTVEVEVEVEEGRGGLVVE